MKPTKPTWCSAAAALLLACALFMTGLFAGRMTAARTAVVLPERTLSRLEVPEASTAAGLVDINRACAEELATLPGIGEVLAGRIIEYREQTGSFAAAEELMNVSGIGEKTFAELKQYITVGSSDES